MPAARVDFDVPRRLVRDNAAACAVCNRSVLLWRDFETDRVLVLDVESGVVPPNSTALRLEPHAFHCRSGEKQEERRDGWER